MSADRVHELTRAGYNKVYIWDAVPNEEDSDHTHLFDVHLEVLSGEIEIRVNDVSSILQSGNSIDIPRNTKHYGKAGVHGCSYIVAEKQ